MKRKRGREEEERKRGNEGKEERDARSKGFRVGKIQFFFMSIMHNAHERF